MLRVLLAAHALPPEEYSGAPLTTLGYAVELARRGCAVSVLYPSPAEGSWSRGPIRRAGEEFDRIPLPRDVADDALLEWSIVAPSDTDRPLVAKALHALLDHVAPDVVHLVNNVYLPLSLSEAAHDRGIPVVRSVTGSEDLCGLVVPVSRRSGDRGACEPPLSPAHCANCVRSTRPDFARGIEATARPGSHGPGTLDAMLRRKRARAVRQFREVFAAAVFPSHGFRRVFEQSLPLAPGAARVVPMGVDLGPWGGATAGVRRPRRARDDETAVTFVVASEKDVAKGTVDVVDAFLSPRLVSRVDWRLRVLGGGDESLVAPLAGHPQVEVSGRYSASELPLLLSGCDVGLSASHAETFHRTTREYLLAGCAVVGTRVGGIPEVIVPGRNGVLVEPADADALAVEIETILDDRELLAALLDGAARTPVRSLDDEVDDLLGVYGEVTEKGSASR